MKSRGVLAFVVAAVLSGAPPVQAQGGFYVNGTGGDFPVAELVAVGGACYVRLPEADGTYDIPCDVLDEEDLEDFSDDEWDDFCDEYGPFLSPEQYAEYCGTFLSGYTIRLTDNIAFSGIGVHLDTGYVMTAPFQRGFLASEVGGTLVNPAFTVDYSMSGYRVGLGLDARLSIDGFSPLKVSTGFEYGMMSGTGTASDVMLSNFGVTSVGVMPGVFANWPTDVLDLNFMVDRSFAALNSRVAFPLVRGRYDFENGVGDAFSHLDYEIYGLVGKRLGFLNQTEDTLINTSTPAFGMNRLSQINYDTRFNGMFAGAQLGLGLDKSSPLEGDLAIQESFSALMGYDIYGFRITDSVDASGLGGALNHSSTNTFDVTAGVPTLELMASVGLGNGKWYAGVKGGFAAGLHPELDYNRPDSVAPATPVQPTLSLKPGWSSQVSADFHFRF
jgi:hypothetical protein